MLKRINKRFKKISPKIKTVGYILTVIGAILLFWGYQLSGTIDSQVTLAFTGTSSDKVVNTYIAGAISFFIGLFIIVRK